LRFGERVPVNKNRILRLLRQHRLLVTANQCLRAKRTPTGRKPEPAKPNEWWGIEMTKVLVGDFGWLYSVMVLDCYTTTMVGSYAGFPCTARHGLGALDMAVTWQFPDGARDRGASLSSGNGCQPALMAFMETCRTSGIHQELTSYNHPRGNTDTERVIRTFKEECLWLQEWSDPSQVISTLGNGSEDYKKHYLHSALGYKPGGNMKGTTIVATVPRSRPLDC
jgi:putative transposase